MTREEVRRAIERSLARIRCERLDLPGFHAWSYADPSYLDSLFYLQELEEEGLIGQLGLTNVDTWSRMKHGRFIREAGGWDALQELLCVVSGVARRHGVRWPTSPRSILEQPALGGVWARGSA